VPLHAALQERLSPQALLSIPWKGENASGHLLVLDKPRMNADDLMLAEITAQGIAARFDHHFFLRQLQQAAALEERVRLSRDLHDGLLQSLTGAALQLETVQRLLEADPQTARQRLLEVQHLIAGEQRDLRTQVQQLKPLAGDLSAEPFELNARIEELAERIRTQWKVSVEVGITPSISRIKGGVGREIYFLVHEGLINAVRHSGASDINAELLFTADGVRIVITDNGHGFPFNGFYDNDALFAMKRGPVTLKERTASLGGTLSIDSQSSGSRLDIALPLAAPGGRDAH
jgi:signal transduction histidine kinase